MRAEAKYVAGLSMVGAWMVAVVLILALAGCAETLGAGAGALAGNQFGKGSGKTAATVGGAVGGAVIGHEIAH